ncbi:MAG: hypothetical protein ACI4QV_06945, partial [Acutalibacteraceae bacterium]
MSGGLKTVISVLAVFLVFSVTLCSVFVIRERNKIEETNANAGSKVEIIPDDLPGTLVSDYFPEENSEDSSENESDAMSSQG